MAHGCLVAMTATCFALFLPTAGDSRFAKAGISLSVALMNLCHWLQLDFEKFDEIWDDGTMNPEPVLDQWATKHITTVRADPLLALALSPSPRNTAGHGTRSRCCNILVLEHRLRSSNQMVIDILQRVVSESPDSKERVQLLSGCTADGS